MKRTRFLLAGCLAVLLSTTGLNPVEPITHAAAAAIQCPSDTASIRKQIPVVMIPGLFGNKDSWGSMVPVLRQIKDAYITEVFDYSANFANAKWITDDNVGPKLVETISCYADASRKNGGLGKVILLGHSMGGLAARYAANKVVDKTGAVITIATPHTGSILGNVAAEVVNSYCAAAYLPGELLRRLITRENCASSLAFTGLSIGSKELSELPKFPPSIPVKAIAGDVTPQMQLGAIKITAKASSGSDNVVHVQSATDEFTSMGNGDGKKIVGCTGIILFPAASDASCAHTNQLNDPTIQQEVKKSIESYIASTKTKPYTFYGLTVRAGSAWTPDGTMSLRIVPTCTTKDQDGRPFRCSKVMFLDPQVSYFWDSVPAGIEWGAYSCPFGPERSMPNDAIDANVVHPKGKRMVGGLQADYFEVDRCTSRYPRAYLRVWKLPGKRYAIMAFERADAPLSELDAMLEAASWK